MTARGIKAFIWAGPFAGLFFVFGLWPLAGFILLVDPQHTADYAPAMRHVERVTIVGGNPYFDPAR